MIQSGVMEEGLCDGVEGEGRNIEGTGCGEYGQTLGIPETGDNFIRR